MSTRSNIAIELPKDKDGNTVNCGWQTPVYLQSMMDLDDAARRNLLAK